jgi:Protein of unknown function (DUF3768)
MYDTEKVRELNDAFRTSFKGGRVMVTRGIASRSDVSEILERIRTFDAFDNDSEYRERDFGALEAGHDSIFWKIDYYSHDLSAGSENPADPNLTVRVLTVMLAEEY